MQALDCLRRYPLFDLLEPAQLDRLSSEAQELSVATGETLFQDGVAATWVYLILEGQVRIVRRAPSGRECTLGRIGPGELCGDYALLPPHCNTASCRAVSPARLLGLPLSVLQQILTALPGVVPNLKN